MRPDRASGHRGDIPAIVHEAHGVCNLPVHSLADPQPTQISKSTQRPSRFGQARLTGRPSPFVDASPHASITQCCFTAYCKDGEGPT